jgi:Uma2 family endonuclease
MASAAVVPFVTVDEYLHTSYEPDADYVDGEIEERNMGEMDHADLQSILVTLFRNHQKAWSVKAFTELRVQVAAARFRVPDITVLPADSPRSPVIVTAPLLCIEILSPEDRYLRSVKKYEDYLAMGVPEVWIFDPAERIVYLRRPGRQIEQRVGKLELAGTPVSLDLADVFRVLDEGR